MPLATGGFKVLKTIDYIISPLLVFKKRLYLISTWKANGRFKNTTGGVDFYFKVCFFLNYIILGVAFSRYTGIK